MYASKVSRRLRQSMGCLGFISISAAALANDGMGEIGIGGMVTLGRTQAIAMESEVLEISPGRIRVDYVFGRRLSQGTDPAHAGRLTVPVMFPLPPYGPELPSPTWAGAPANFNVVVNGKPQAFKTQIKGLQPCEPEAPKAPEKADCTKDVTGELKAAGLSDAQIALFPNSTPFRDSNNQHLAVPALKPAQKAQLLRQGLLGPGGPEEQDVYPAWLAAVSYVWQMQFEGIQPIKVSHSYTPFTSGGSVSDYFTEEELRKDYCASDGFIAAWKALLPPMADPKHRYLGPLPGRRIAYILSTANSWAEPIGSFTLRLKKDKPSALVSLCFPGPFKRVDPLTLEVTLQNFSPTQELRVAFINVDPASAPNWPAQPPAGLWKGAASR